MKQLLNHRIRMIYLDMDGVMAAFDELVKSWIERDVGWETTPDITDGEWMWLAENHPRLFTELPVCKGAPEFAELLRQQYELPDYPKTLFRPFKIEFLTAIPRSTTFKYAAQDKILWAQKNFPGWNVCIGPYSKDKMKLARIGDILIDDRIDNLKGWVGMGGQGIYHSTNSGTHGFAQTTIALSDAARNTLPGLWKDGKRIAVAA